MMTWTLLIFMLRFSGFKCSGGPTAASQRLEGMKETKAAAFLIIFSRPQAD